jgi:hypothetical protein
MLRVEPPRTGLCVSPAQRLDTGEGSPTGVGSGDEGAVMSAFVLIIVMLLSIAFWREVAALLAVGVIILVVFGFVFLVQTASGGTGGFGG